MLVEGIIYMSVIYYSISELRNLEILNMSDNNLSDKLPDDMFTSLQSLRKLNIGRCELTTLPNRYVLYIYILYIIIVVV